MAEISITPNFDEETQERIWQAVTADIRFQPFYIWFDEPYDEIAFYLEHGSGPAQKKEAPRSDGKKAFDRIGDWVAVQYKGEPRYKVKNLSYKMYDQIMKTGTAPLPFIRPAVDETFNSDDARKVFERNGDTADLAQLVIDRMVAHLHKNGSDKIVNGDSIVHHIHWSLYNDDVELSDMANTTGDILDKWERMDDMNKVRHDSLLAQYRMGRL